MIMFKLSLTVFCHAHPGTPQMCHTLTMRRCRIRNSLISLPLASISSDKVQWSWSPGSLLLLAGPIGLMATPATKFNKNKVWIAGRHNPLSFFCLFLFLLSSYFSFSFPLQSFILFIFIPSSFHHK